MRIIPSCISIIPGLLLALISSLHADEAPLTMPVWPVGKMPGTVAAAPEKENPAKGDGVVRVTNVSEPAITVYRAPSATAAAPAVIICPGGGYQILAINKEGSEIARWLNTLGITGIVLKYRVPNNREGAMQDLQRAVRLVRSHHKEWNIDGTRLGVMGFSAGGHLCARLSTHFGTAFYPRIDEVDQLGDRPDFAVLVYPAYLEKDGLLAKEVAVSTKVPPTFLTQTEDDKGFIAGTKIYAAALQEAKVAHEFALYQTGGHGYGLRCDKEAKAWSDRCAAWLKKVPSTKK